MEDGYIRMIQCFLQPNLMIHRKEAPNSLIEKEVLELDPDGRAQVMPREDHQIDPVYLLFMPHKQDEFGEFL